MLFIVIQQYIDNNIKSYGFYHLQTTSHITVLYVSLSTVTPCRWLWMIAETCRGTFVIQILTQLVSNQRDCMPVAQDDVQH